MDSSTVEHVVVVAVALLPLAGFLPLYRFGQRRGWTTRRVIRSYAFVMWLWYSAVAGVAFGEGLSGFVFVTLLLGTIIFLALRLAGWAYKDIIDREEHYLEGLKGRKDAGSPQ